MAVSIFQVEKGLPAMSLPTDNMTTISRLLAQTNEKSRIEAAITTGAQWEIWMQTELAVLFRQAGFQATREVAYGNNNYLDLLVQLTPNQHLAIELKCESATNAGEPPLRKITDDWQKIRNYPVTPTSIVTVIRLVIFIGYSATKRQQMHKLAAQHPTAIWIADHAPYFVAMIDADQHP